jgi:hypothetical protein
MKSQLLSSVGGASLKFSSLKSQLPGSPKKIPEHFNDDRMIAVPGASQTFTLIAGR